MTALITPSRSPQIYSDVSDTFNAHPVTNDLLLVTGTDSVVQSVMNLVMMNHYDIPFHPEIGGNVTKLLFELADSTTAQLLASEISDVIANFEPRAQIQTLNVQANGILNGFDVTIIFTVSSNPNPVQVSFFLERLR